MRRLGDTDLRLLRIFATLVDCNGFQNAQIALNMAPSTLSAHLASLEAHLGSRLCERGRRGFRLTPEGEDTYRAAQELFGAIEGFGARMTRVHRRGARRLRLAAIDTVLSFDALGLTRALAAFSQAHPDAFVDFEILPPDQIGRALVEGRRDLVIAPAFQAGPTLLQRDLAAEEHRLYCARAHPWFERDDATIGPADVQAARLSVRAYRYFDDTYKLGGARPAASVTSMEAQAMLILSGGFVGYLPIHCAAPHVASGALRAVRPREWQLRSRFALAYDPASEPRQLKRLFAACLCAAGRDATPGEPGP